mgnify:FL=1|jgi:hypothetical protein
MLEYNCKVFGCSSYFAFDDAEFKSEGALGVLEALAEGKVDVKETRYNSTRDVVLSLFRSRDDNLIWVASSLLTKLITKASPAVLTSTRLVDKSVKSGPLFMLLGFAHSLLCSESEFRLCTVKSLGCMMLWLAKLVELRIGDLSENVRASLTSQAQAKLASIVKLSENKTSFGMIVKRLNLAIDEYM